ncbi:MAG: hypothetical protein O3B43_04290 [Chloroflexi bacterium]|nr:hypothetical protein [Chloroflexota bacterium]
MGLVSRIIEQSQTRVEGANFDSRKHLLEYDDVLNSQRATVYAQRDRIMSKEELSDDVIEMLQTEIATRVPMALADEDGPWKLLAWLEQIQPSVIANRVLLPSFIYQLLIQHLKELKIGTKAEAREALLDVARHSLEAEERHLLTSVERLLDSSEDRFDEQLKERLDTVDIFFEGLELADETDVRPPSELFNDLVGTLHLPIKLNPAEQKLLREDPDEVADVVQTQVEQVLREQSVTRLIGAVERRLDSELGLDAAQLAETGWDAAWEAILSAIKTEFENRRERLVGNGNGQIAVDVETQLDKVNGEVNEAHLLNSLIVMPQGTVTTFDKKTHKRVNQRTNRLSFAYFAANFLEKLPENEVTERVLAHLTNTQKAMEYVWGQAALEVGQASNGKSLEEVPDAEKQEALEQMGAKALTEAYRQLLLRVISELWVEYLTQMEALRISVGLEAYAQRDPLVEYKAQAFRMFQQLFNDMRSGVVNRMFLFQPGAAQQQAQAQAPQIQAQAPEGNGGAAQSQPKKAKTGETSKRKRRRRRK